MSISPTKQVFGSKELTENIAEFLSSMDRRSYRSVSHDCHEAANLIEKILLSERREMRREKAYQAVFGNALLRPCILQYLTPADRDRCKRVKRSYNRNVTAFQKVIIPRLLPAELASAVARATFQNLHPPVKWQIPRSCVRWQVPADEWRIDSDMHYLKPENLADRIVVGFERGRPYLACKVDELYNERVVDRSVIVLHINPWARTPGQWVITSNGDLHAGSNFRHRVSSLAAFLDGTKMWSGDSRFLELIEPRSCWGRCFDRMRGIKRPDRVDLELRLAADAKSPIDKGDQKDNKKA